MYRPVQYNNKVKAEDIPEELYGRRLYGHQI